MLSLESFRLSACQLVQDAEGYEDYGTVVGAVRLGEKASIGQGYWMTAHGGAVSCACATL